MNFYQLSKHLGADLFYYKEEQDQQIKLTSYYAISGNRVTGST